jgi:hypothetical protein
VADKDESEVVRVRAAYVVLVLIAFATIWDIIGLGTIDLASYGTLVGALLALLRVGSVVKLIGRK